MPLYVAIILIALIVAGFVYGAFWLSARADRIADDEWIAMSRKDFGDRTEVPMLPRWTGDGPPPWPTSASDPPSIRKPPVHSTPVAGKGRPDHVL